MELWVAEISRTITLLPEFGYLRIIKACRWRASTPYCLLETKCLTIYTRSRYVQAWWNRRQVARNYFGVPASWSNCPYLNWWADNRKLNLNLNDVGNRNRNYSAPVRRDCLQKKGRFMRSFDVLTRQRFNPTAEHSPCLM